MNFYNLFGMKNLKLKHLNARHSVWHSFCTKIGSERTQGVAPSDEQQNHIHEPSDGGGSFESSYNLQPWPVLSTAMVQTGPWICDLGTWKLWAKAPTFTKHREKVLRCHYQVQKRLGTKTFWVHFSHFVSGSQGWFQCWRHPWASSPAPQMCPSTWSWPGSCPIGPITEHIKLILIQVHGHNNVILNWYYLYALLIYNIIIYKLLMNFTQWY